MGHGIAGIGRHVHQYLLDLSGVSLYQGFTGQTGSEFDIFSDNV
jgi:hypothetical protein